MAQKLDGSTAVQPKGHNSSIDHAATSGNEGPPLRVRPAAPVGSSPRLPAWWYDGIRFKKGTIPVLAAGGILLLMFMAWRATTSDGREVVAESSTVSGQQASLDGVDGGVQADDVLADGSDPRASGSFGESTAQTIDLFSGNAGDLGLGGLDPSGDESSGSDDTPDMNTATTVEETTTTTVEETTTTTVEETTTTTTEDVPPADAYLLVNAASGGCASAPGLEVGQIVVERCQLNDEQLFSVSSAGPGIAVSNIATGMVFDIAGASMSEGGELILYPAHLDVNQQWILSGTNSGQTIISVSSNMCLHAADGGQVIQLTCNQGAKQIWSFQPARQFDDD